MRRGGTNCACHSTNTVQSVLHIHNVHICLASWCSSSLQENVGSLLWESGTPSKCKQQRGDELSILFLYIYELIQSPVLVAEILMMYQVLGGGIVDFSTELF